MTGRPPRAAAARRSAAASLAPALLLALLLAAEVLVPFVTALVPEVDLAGGRLVVADRPGLLDPEP